jgi:hypothetical protein
LERDTMLAAVSEGTMRVIRAVLALGWVMLTASLFWDPLTLHWTMPGASSTWLWLGSPSNVQGARFVEAPYAVGAHVFWTFIIPVVPLFLMVFGHNTWRRLCPLSFLTQLPGYLGLQRQMAGRNRPPVIAATAWLRRRAWRVQFGLLVLALAARLLFINSDRLALGLFMVGVMGLALLVGALWGGKTWCHTLCPINVVQMMYTGPGGLLEGREGGVALPKSMCRAPSPTGDVARCVGCVRACPDIDQEKSYAATLAGADGQLVYYGFFGLIVGFYAYFFLYSGDWGYYFSGDWSHVPSQAAELLSPGFYLGGQAIAIPKLIAAPATLLIAVLAAWGLGNTLEKGYAAWRVRRERPVSALTLRHRCFSVSAFLSINVFYLFSGRSNLGLLPDPVIAAVNFLLVALTTAWLVKALHWEGMTDGKIGARP